MREIRVGLAGLGHVGSAAASLLHRTAEGFVRRFGARLTLHAVCDASPAKARGLGLPRGVRVERDWRRLTADPAVDIVVELIGGQDPAKRLVLEAFAAGKDVVTANKALLSRQWPEVVGAAQAAGRRLAFEGSVCAGIPIIGSLARSLAPNGIRQILGILNGTTNFILSRMTCDRCPAGAALREARRLGLAERDPRLDLDGSDSAHKLSVLASVVLGRWLDPARVGRAGIESVGLDDALFAVEELGRTVRLLGLARFEDGPEGPTVEARVCPTLVPLRHPLAAVHDAYNAVMLETSEAKDLMFYGLGAGAGPAASAVVGDLWLLAEARLGGRAAPPLLWAREGRVAVRKPEDCLGRFYLRFQASDRPGVLGRIAQALGRQGVSIAHVHQRSRSGSARTVPVVLVTHAAPEGRVRRAIEAVAGRDGVSRRVALMRLL
ncbi:MAG: homoserine dehydrogenase [Elusimicrobia bacterium]|nr:homoserine dehydrogenase [Elusimicrobiota bacterium]